MTPEIISLSKQALANIDQAVDEETLETLRVTLFGKQGTFTAVLKSLSALEQDERRAKGALVNELKERVQKHLNDRREHLKTALLKDKLAKETIDVTLPGLGVPMGKLHPLTCTWERVEEIFIGLGFSLAKGPEIEDDYYNFTALNIPENHPARTEQDTFHFGKNTVLRTQTSTVQIRAMESFHPPLKIIAPGRVYRHDSDITHTPMFHQTEGLWVDETVTFADLKSLLSVFLTQFFNRAISIRFRPSYFPFTEPSAEVDVACVRCSGKGCRVCKRTGWLEILGCGMVHPNVFAQVKVDAKRYRGFAFGMGLERLAMIQHGIEDIRALYENDLRFLKQI